MRKVCAGSDPPKPSPRAKCCRPDSGLGVPSLCLRWRLTRKNRLPSARTGITANALGGGGVTRNRAAPIYKINRKEEISRSQLIPSPDNDSASTGPLVIRANWRTVRQTRKKLYKKDFMPGKILVPVESGFYKTYEKSIIWKFFFC